MFDNSVVLEQIVPNQIQLVIICHIVDGAPSARLAANKLRVSNIAPDIWVHMINVTCELSLYLGISHCRHYGYGTAGHAATLVVEAAVGYFELQHVYETDAATGEANRLLIVV